MKRIVEMDPLILTRGLESKIIDQPVVIRVIKFEEDSAKEFSEQISRAHNTGQPIIPVIIDSYGGQVYSLMSMIADIENSKLPVATIVCGKAMSCGAILFACGAEGFRYVDPNATIMIHDVSLGTYGKNEEVKADSKQGDRLNQKIYRMMAQKCGHKDPEYFLKIIHERSHAEWYLTAKQALKHKLANEIKVPNLVTRIKVETVLE